MYLSLAGKVITLILITGHSCHSYIKPRWILEVERSVQFMKTGHERHGIDAATRTPMMKKPNSVKELELLIISISITVVVLISFVAVIIIGYYQQHLC